MNPYRQEEMGKYAMEIPVEALGALEASRATAPQPRREPEMAQAVRRLNECTKDLRLNLQTLLVRLVTVMRSEPPQPEQVCESSVSTGAALLDWTNEKVEEVQQANSVVQSMLDRLEI